MTPDNVPAQPDAAVLCGELAHANRQLALQLSNAGYAVLSGGGPGIMEAANKGAHAGKSPAVRLNIKLPHEQHTNPYQNISLHFQYLAARKMVFEQHACAFIIFAGGFGTLDELFETLTLTQTNIMPRRPIILVGRSFWQGLHDWITAQLVTRKLIGTQDPNLLHLCDSNEEIMQIIRQAA